MPTMKSVTSLKLAHLKGLDAWGWCTGTTQRDGMGREEEGGFRMGNTCIPWWIHFDICQNQYNIVKFKNKIKFKKIKLWINTKK